MKQPVALNIMPDEAAQVKDGWLVARQRDFTGGENLATLPEMVGRNQFIRMENALISPSGFITPAHQTDTRLLTNATAGVCLALLTSGLYTFFAAPGDNKLYAGILDTSSGSPVNVGTATTYSVTGAYIKGFSHVVTFLGKNYALNSNPNTSYNGVLNLTDRVLTAIAGKTSTKLKAYTNRLWVVNSDGTLQCSDNGDATTWDALNVLLLPNSEPVIDFIPIQGGAIVYGKTAIYAMYGSDYLDIAFVPLIFNKHFTSGNVEVNGVVYILSTEGIYAVTLNRAELIPHNQQSFFQSIFPVLVAASSTISAINIARFSAILFTWPTSYTGTQSFIYYYAGKGAYSKINKLLPTDYPYILGLNDKNTDYLVGVAAGAAAKSTYPPVDLLGQYNAYLQTRHEDFDITRLKIWQFLIIEVQEYVYGVTIDTYLDYSNTPIRIATNTVLSPGENLFNFNASEGLSTLQNFPASTTISVLIAFNNFQTATNLIAGDTLDTFLTDETGAVLTFATSPAHFTFKGIRVKFRETGLMQ